MRSEVDLLIQELTRQGITDTRVLAAMESLPREAFLSADQAGEAYENRALPIDCDQTISQPYIVALMTQSLELTGNERVLEIGTGSGYQTAVLARLCSHVDTIERWARLANAAREALRQQGIDNISYFTGDGTQGLPMHAPYDAILVTAAAPRIPPCYWEQVKLNGRLVIPIGDEYSQNLMLFRKTREGWDARELCPCRFVKLIGQQAWPAHSDPDSGSGI